MHKMLAGIPRAGTDNPQPIPEVIPEMLIHC
jgi:hypothetical protein